MENSSFSTHPNAQAKPPKIGGSLARRVALISCTFLILPLLLYSFYVYHKIYNEQFIEVFRDLKRVEHEQVEILSSWIHYEMEVLHLLFHIIDSRQQLDEHFSQTDLETLLANFSKREQVSAFAYLGLDECTKKICKATSSPAVTNKEIFGNLSLSDFEQSEELQYLHYFPNVGNSLVLVRSFPINRKEKQPIQAVLAGVININNLLGKLSIIRTRFKENISFLDQHGVVLASTEARYVSKTISASEDAFFQLHTSKIGHKGLYFQDNGKIRYATLIAYEPAKLYVLLDVPEFSVLKHWYTYLEKLVILLALILVIGGGATAIITSRISKPLRKLIEDMAQVGSGDLTTRYQKDKMGFEINQLGETFNQMVESLIKHIAQAEEEKVKREVYLNELQIGQRAQLSLLPRSFSGIDRFDIEGGCIPAKEVGGDFYDLFQDTRNRVMFCVADTSGKGIQACIFSLLVRSMLRSFFYSGEDLNSIIKETNALFLKDTGISGMFVTMWMGIIDLDTGEIEYTSCGHLPGIHLNQENKIHFLSTNGAAIGVESFEPEVKKLHLKKDESLILYTDGIIEAHSEENELYGQDRLIQIIKEKPWSNAEELIHNVQVSVRDFAHAKPQHDDLTMLVIKCVQE